MGKKHRKMCRILNYFEHFVFISAVSGCVSVFPFASLVGVPVGITSSAVGLKICALTAGIKTYKLIIKKKNKRHDKVVLLAKTKLNAIKVLVSKALINSYINLDKFVSGNNVLIEYEMKEEIENPVTTVEYAI